MKASLGFSCIGALLPLLQIAACGGGESGTSATTSGTATSAATTGATTGTGGTGGATSSATTGAGGATSSSSTGAGGQAMGCMNDLAAGHHVFKCDGGIGYDVEIPAACASGCGLVLDMHGYTMTAELEDKGTQMRALGQKNGYVVVQPTAPGSPSSWDQATHAPLVFAFVKDLAAALAIDPKRVHAMGFSQGGGMTWRMICAHADYFASASPIGGITGCEFSGGNVPSQEIPILQVHGHKDAIVSFMSTAVPQRDAALAYWKYDAGATLEEDATHKATRYKTAAGTVLDFWEHDYQAGSFILGGHCFPGGTDVGASPFQFGCMAMGTFVYGELAMQFFLDHPKP